MGETADIMKYRRAEQIRSLISELDSSWVESTYVAAIQEDPFTLHEYKVYLFSRDGYKHHLIDLAAFANALNGLASDIHYTMSEYNKATYGEDMTPAIEIW